MFLERSLTKELRGLSKEERGKIADLLEERIEAEIVRVQGLSQDERQSLSDAPEWPPPTLAATSLNRRELEVALSQVGSDWRLDIIVALEELL